SLFEKFEVASILSCCCRHACKAPTVFDTSCLMTSNMDGLTAAMTKAKTSASLGCLEEVRIRVATSPILILPRDHRTVQLVLHPMESAWSAIKVATKSLGWKQFAASVLS